MKTIILATVLTATMATAETSPPVPLNTGALICDTVEDVIETIETKKIAPTCGLLQIPMVATITEMPVFEHDGYTFLIARYDFTANVSWKTQYGFWGKPLKTNASLGSSL